MHEPLHHIAADELPHHVVNLKNKLDRLRERVFQTEVRMQVPWEVACGETGASFVTYQRVRDDFLGVLAVDDKARAVAQDRELNRSL